MSDRTWRAPLAVRLGTVAPALGLLATAYAAQIPDQRLSDLVVLTLIGGAIVAYWALFGSTRLTLRPQDRCIIVVNILTTRIVPVEAVEAIQCESGLQIRTRGNDVLVWQGMGASYLRTWTGNKSARRVAAEIETAFGQIGYTRSSASRTVETSLRSAAIWVGFGVPLALAIGGGLIHLATH